MPHDIKTLNCFFQKILRSVLNEEAQKFRENKPFCIYVVYHMHVYVTCRWSRLYIKGVVKLLHLCCENLVFKNTSVLCSDCLGFSFP